DIQSLSLQASSTDTCQHAPIQFTGSATVLGDVINEWIWDFGNGDSAFVQNPVYAFPQTGNFTVKLKIRAGLDCYQTVQTNININPGPLLDFSANTVCLGSPTVFTDNSSYPPGVFEVFRRWYFGDGDSSDVFNPTYTYSAPGTYNVKLVVETNTGCKNERIKPIFVAPIPTANANVISACLADTIHFLDASTILPIDSIVSWTWNISGYGTFNTKNVSILPNSSASINYQLTVISSNGCSSNFSGSIPSIIGTYFDVSPNPVCGNTSLTLQNLSAGSSNYQWDFCLGDLNNIPQRVANYGLLDGQSLNFVKDPFTNNWYAFVANPSGLVRLDFGNSVNNTPTINFLGSLGITTSMFSKVVVAYDGIRWMGYMGNASNRLLVFDFGTSITNVPTSSTTNVLTGISNARNVGLVKYNNQWFFIVNNPSASFAVFTTGSILTNNLTHLQTVTSPVGSTVYVDSKILQKCNGIEVILTNYNGPTSSVDKYFFTQMNTPPTRLSFPTGINAALAFIELGFDNNQWHAFLFANPTTAASVRKLVFNSNLTVRDTAFNLPNLNLTDLRGTALIKEQSTWYLFLLDRNADSLVKFVFPDTCFANIVHSNQFQPNGLSYSRGGTYGIELNGITNQGIPVTKVKSIDILPTPEADFEYANPCSGDSIAFTSTSTVLGGTIIQYEWDFGDGNVSSLPNPKHQYASTGNYNVQLIVTSDFGCKDTIIKNVTYQPGSGSNIPVANANVTFGCLGDSVYFSDVSTIGSGDSIVSWVWNISSYGSYNTPDVSILPTSAGNISYTLTVTSSLGCSDTYSGSISIDGLDFQILQSPLCAYTPIQLQNESAGITNFEWDFCLGDLNNRPQRVANYPLLDARSLNFVQDPVTQNWYAFVVNPSGLVRLDFGNSVNNTPTYNILGTFGITSSMFSKVVVAYDGTKWFGYMGNASSRLITFDFGSSLTNIPTSTTTAVLTGVTNSRNVEIFKYQGQWYIVVVNVNTNIAVFTSGSILSSTLTHLQTITSTTSGAQFTDVKAVVRCSSVEVLLMNFATASSSVNKLTFYQMDQPPLETVFATGANAGLGFIALGYDNEKWNGFLIPASGGFLRRMVWNSTLTVRDTIINVLNPNLNSIRGYGLVKEQSTWYLFLTDLNADSLVKFVFPDTCFANMAYSTQFQPTGISYSQGGIYGIELSGNTNQGVKLIQTHYIEILPTPHADFVYANAC
ncbi:MAG: PKD domain-containing protein, partial [Candidatus Pacearchaeota archaeon]